MAGNKKRVSPCARVPHFRAYINVCRACMRATANNGTNNGFENLPIALKLSNKFPAETPRVCVCVCVLRCLCWKCGLCISRVPVIYCDDPGKRKCGQRYWPPWKTNANETAAGIKLKNADLCNMQKFRGSFRVWRVLSNAQTGTVLSHTGANAEPSLRTYPLG